MDTIEKVEKEMDEFRKNHSILYIIDNIRYRLSRIIKRLKVRNIYKSIQYAIQRLDRGYSDRDTWSFDYYLSNVIAGGLKYLRDNGRGIPNRLYYKFDKDTVNADKKWKKILNKIINSFEVRKKIINGELWYISQETFTKEKYENSKQLMESLNIKFPEFKTYVMNLKEVIEYEEGLELFIKYLGEYWD